MSGLFSTRSFVTVTGITPADQSGVPSDPGKISTLRPTSHVPVSTTKYRSVHSWSSK